MAPSMKAIGFACALGFSAVRGLPDDAAALVQSSVRSHATALTEPNVFNEALGDIVNVAVQQVEEAKNSGEMIMAQEPGHEEEKAPIWHGLQFQRQIVQMEAGSSGYMSFDHGCKVKDDHGDNFCEFPHGDSIHMKFEFNLAKPINNGYWVFQGVPKLQGVPGFLRNGIEGRRGHILTSRLDDISVECPICGGVCEPIILGKQRTIKLPECPLPAGQNVTLVDMDINLPSGLLLPLVKMQMRANLVVHRQEGEDSNLVSESKFIFAMGRIYHGMPLMM